MRDSTIFYRSFYEAIKELPAQNQAEVYAAIFEYSLNFSEIKLTGLSKTIFTLIKPQLDANLKRFRNGSEPKTKQEESKTEAKPKLTVSKTEANNNNNVNNNKNLNVNLNENINVNNKQEVYKSVFLSLEEIEKLKEKFGAGYLWAVETLSNYKQSSGKKYKSDYHALIGWVHDKFLKEKQNGKSDPATAPRINGIRTDNKFTQALIRDAYIPNSKEGT